MYPSPPSVRTSLIYVLACSAELYKEVARAAGLGGEERFSAHSPPLPIDYGESTSHSSCLQDWLSLHKAHTLGEPQTSYFPDCVSIFYLLIYPGGGGGPLYRAMQFQCSDRILATLREASYVCSKSNLLQAPTTASSSWWSTTRACGWSSTRPTSSSATATTRRRASGCRTSPAKCPPPLLPPPSATHTLGPERMRSADRAYQWRLNHSLHTIPESMVL